MITTNSGNNFGVIGLGNIGCSTMINYAAKHIKVIGYDISSTKVGEIQKGIISTPGMQEWVEHPVSSLVEQGFVNATTSKEEFAGYSPKVIFVAVPTEIKGIPSPQIISDTFTWVFQLIDKKLLKAPTLIVESTMAPGTMDKVILPLATTFGLTLGKDVFIGISPRRDWFKIAGKTVKDMERVYGGVTGACAVKTREALSVICEKLFPASTYRVAELTKCLENAFRFIEISLANQFALAYPEIDIIETLELASTKWNMGLYRPSIKIGGHCVPVAPRYVLEGAQKPEFLSLITAALNAENNVIASIIEMLKPLSIKRVAILGLGYRDNFKIPIFSPSVDLVKQLLANGFEVTINDPLFTNEEIERETGLTGCSVEECMAGAEALFVIALHTEYLDYTEMIAATPTIKLVIDNTGQTKGWNWNEKVSYAEVGDGKFLDSAV